MRIFINTSTLYVGGGVQVALSFINELKHLNCSHVFMIVTSTVINQQLEQDKFSDNFEFKVIQKSPASLKYRKGVCAVLDELEKGFSPHIVFTVFGPSYWTPKATHIMGFADGWVYNPSSIAYKELRFLNRIKLRSRGIYKKYYLKRDADFFILETHDARNKLSEILSIDLDRIYVIGNTYSSVFCTDKYLDENNEYYIKLPEKKDKEIRLLYIAHNHPNKNLKVINEVVKYFEDQKLKFILTIDHSSFKSLFSGVSDFIINVGPVAQKSCPSLYFQSDVLFAPTLLETFSAAYPEAMKMQKLILTSDYSFAKDLCGDAAVYFDPLDPEDIAKKIKQVIADQDLQTKIIENGQRKLISFETARSRACKYIKLCEGIVKKSL